MAENGTHPIRVLLVEDNSTHAHIIQRHLEKAGRNGMVWERVPRLDRAMERLNAGAIDALLLDLSLPDSEINDTLSHVIKIHSHVPIIVLTSLEDLEFATRAIAQGADDFLVKTDLSSSLLIRSINYAIERKKTRERLASYAAGLESSNEQLKSFAHTVAHEVKSPLTVVSACLHVLEGNYRGQITAEHWEYIEQAETAVRGLAAMVNDLLEFSRMGSDRPSCEQVDMEAVFYHAYICLRPAINNANAVISHDPLPIVRGNDLQLRQLLLNLMGNAIKYCDNQPPEIYVSAKENEADWEFGVRDNGVGIAPEDQERIFEAFVRLHNDLEVSGSGIGLAFCQQIVNNHGGRIWVESNPNEGSTFFFTLPRESQPGA